MKLNKTNVRKAFEGYKKSASSPRSKNEVVEFAIAVFGAERVFEQWECNSYGQRFVVDRVTQSIAVYRNNDKPKVFDFTD